MLRPSGDQTGFVSFFGSNVKRVGMPRPSSILQISLVLVCGSDRLAATCFSSGEREGVLKRPGSPTVPRGWPVRSNHTNWSFRSPPES